MLLIHHTKFVQIYLVVLEPGGVAQLVGHLTRKSGVLGSIPGLTTYFRFSLRFFKKGSCQLLAKVCARSTGCNFDFSNKLKKTVIIIININKK